MFHVFVMSFLGKDLPIVVFYRLISLRVHVKSMPSDLQTGQKQSMNITRFYSSLFNFCVKWNLNGIKTLDKHSGIFYSKCTSACLLFIKQAEETDRANRIRILFFLEASLDAHGTSDVSTSNCNSITYRGITCSLVSAR